MKRRRSTLSETVGLLLSLLGPEAALLAGDQDSNPPVANDSVSIERVDPDIVPDADAALQADRPVETQAEDEPVAEPVVATEPDGASTESHDSPHRLGVPSHAFQLGPRASESEESASFLGHMDPRTNEYARVAMSTLLVIGLILLLRVFVGRMAPGLGRSRRPSGVLEIMARYPIAKGQHLVLLKLGRRIVLTHQSANAMTTISEITDPEEVASLLARVEAGSNRKKDKSFRLMLNRFESEHDFSNFAQAHGEIDVIDLTQRPRRANSAARTARRLAS